MGNEHMARWTMSIWLLVGGISPEGRHRRRTRAGEDEDGRGRQAHEMKDCGLMDWLETKKGPASLSLGNGKLAGPSRDKDDLPRLTQLVTSKGYPPHIPSKALPGECRASASGGRHHDIYTALRVTSRHGIDPDL